MYGTACPTMGLGSYSGWTWTTPVSSEPGLIQAGAFISYANFEHFSGVSRTFSQGLERSRISPATLRLKAPGRDCVHIVSQDSVDWTSFRTLEVPLPAEMKLGVAAVNASTKPFAGELEGLTLLPAVMSMRHEEEARHNDSMRNHPD